MKLGEFKIGEEFECGGHLWLCTDIGGRVAVAIKRGSAEFDGDLSRRQRIDPSWCNGPPYAVAEHVFDEDDQKGCTRPR